MYAAPVWFSIIIGFPSALDLFLHFLSGITVRVLKKLRNMWMTAVELLVVALAVFSGAAAAADPNMLQDVCVADLASGFVFNTILCMLCTGNSLMFH